MNAKYLIFFTGFLLFLSGCQKEKSRSDLSKAEPDTIPKSASIIQINPNLLKFLEGKLESSYCHPKDTLFALLGQPLSISADTVSNPYYNVPDSEFTLNYDGLTVKLDYITGDGRTLLTHVTMTNPTLLTEFGVPEGTRRDSLELRLHKKTNAIIDRPPDGVTLEYVIDEEDAPSYLQFTFVENRLDEIEYFPYSD
jgi:hypothetical protein